MILENELKEMYIRDLPPEIKSNILEAVQLFLIRRHKENMLPELEDYKLGQLAEELGI